jgi:hypothetical protein
MQAVSPADQTLSDLLLHTLRSLVATHEWLTREDAWEARERERHEPRMRSRRHQPRDRRVE